MKKVTCFLMAAMLLILLAVPAMASVNSRGIDSGMILYVDTANGGSLNVREAGKADAKVIKQIQNGAAVIAGDSINGNYLQVTVIGSAPNPDIIGWVDMRFLSVSAPSGKTTPVTTDETVKSLNFRSYKLVEGYFYVAAKPSRAGGYVNLRWVPSTEASVIEKLYAGTELEVIAEGSAWYQVKCPEGYVGFVMKKFTQITYKSLEPRVIVDTTAAASAN